MQSNCAVANVGRKAAPCRPFIFSLEVKPFKVELKRRGSMKAPTLLVLQVLHLPSRPGVATLDIGYWQVHKLNIENMGSDRHRRAPGFSLSSELQAGGRGDLAAVCSRRGVEDEAALRLLVTHPPVAFKHIEVSSAHSV